MAKRPGSVETEPQGGFRARVTAVLARLRGGELTPGRLSASVALGLFIGCTPLYGFHGLLVLSSAPPLRLDSLVTYLASNISLPPMIPILLFLEAQIGTWILERRFLSVSWQELAPENVGELALALAVGTPFVGAACALIGGALTLVAARRFQSRRSNQ